MTHRRLYNRFSFAPGQELEIKGKGRMQVFPLERPLQREPQAATA